MTLNLVIYQRQCAAHDFFEPQPIKGPAVYLLKYILHDWPDAYAKKILQHLRDAASQETRLVVMDRIIPYACRIPKDADEGTYTIPGMLKTPEIAPLSVASPEQISYLTSIVVSILPPSDDRPT